MSDQHHRPLRFVDTPLALFGDQFCHQRHAACRDVDPAFPAVRCPSGVVPPRQPGTRRRGIDLEMGQPLPVAQMRLAQPGIDQYRLPSPLTEHDRGVQGPSQIRGHDEHWLPFGKHLRGGRSLLAAQVTQLGVELALHPAACVVLGLPVPQHDQSADPHSDGSSSTVRKGQSRHSRSKA